MTKHILLFLFSTSLLCLMLGLSLNHHTPQPQLSPISNNPVAPTPTPKPSINLSDISEEPYTTYGWNSFSDSEFSILYPPTWPKPTFIPLSTRTEYLFTPTNLSIVAGSYYLQNLGRSQSYSEAIQAVEKYAIGKQPVTVANVSTYIYSHAVGNLPKEKTVVLKAPSGSFIWISMPMTKIYDPAIFDLALSSFKFTSKHAAPTPGLTPRTYTNSKFGFSIQIPAGADTSIRDPDPFPVAVEINSSKPPTGGGWLMIISEPQPNSSKLTLVNWSTFHNLLISADQEALIPSNTTVAKRPAIVWNSKGGEGQFRYYLIQKSTTSVVFIIVNKGTSHDSYFDRILSTFQFAN